jgi:hypothetical protein
MVREDITADAVRLNTREGAIRLLEPLITDGNSTVLRVFTGLPLCYVWQTQETLIVGASKSTAYAHCVSSSEAA